MLLLHYNDALKDLPGTVKTISAFYGVLLSDEELSAIAAKASLDSINSMRGRFNYRLWGHPTYFEGRAVCVEEGTLLRKGVSGDGRSIFSTDEIRELRLYQEDYFRGGPDILSWAREGGTLP